MRNKNHLRKSQMTRTNTEQLEWFKNAKLGLFIHWGLFSLTGRGEWVMRLEMIPNDEYATFADDFKPERFDADEWALAAKRAGMTYMVLTTRHHDGFCLFDSAVSDFTSVKTAAKRDFVAEYVEACRRHGLGVGLYYSLGDWRFGFPKVSGTAEEAEQMVAQAHGQVRELLSQYGKIDILWYDGTWKYPSLVGDTHAEIAQFWNSKKLNAMARDLQPEILINNRSGLPEDFGTPEQEVKPDPNRVWECCMTIGDYRGWGYLKHDPTTKTSAQLINSLVTAITSGGNFLLNVGPGPDGVIMPEEANRLEEIGRWVSTYAEAIYGTIPSEIKGAACGFCMKKKHEDTHYLFVLHWPGPEGVIVSDPGLHVTEANLLPSGRRLLVTHKNGHRLVLSGLPSEPVDPYCSVVKLACKRNSVGNAPGG
jgi:alpha-L-fucosidase